MPLNYSYIPEQDFSKGIDQHSAEANIQSGYVEDALNVDIAERRLVKRRGYQTHAGCIPFRVQEIVYDLSENEIQFFLDDSLDLSVILDTPIIVFGRTSITGSGGDFSSIDTGVYYDTISTDPRKSLTGATTTITDAGFTDSDFLVKVTHSLSTTNFDNETVEMDRIEILDADYDVRLTHTLTPDPLSTFVTYYDTSNSTGDVYNYAIGNVLDGDTVNDSVDAATHNLDNFNIMVFIKARNAANDGDEFFEVDTVTIDNTGEVFFQFTNNSGLTLTNVRAILVAVPSANVKTGTFAASNLAQNIIISNISDPFIFSSLYQEDTVTGDLTLVKPDKISYDSALEQYTLEVIVGTDSNFKFFYDFGFTLTNVIKVTPYINITANASDETPQMTIWGLCHDTDGIYGANKIAREGWTNHIDSYKTASEQRLVAGLGGNLFTSRTRTELDTAYKLPSLLTDLRNRVSTNTKVGPLFRETGSTYARSRGYINRDGDSSSLVEITTIAYQETGPRAGTVKYTLNCPNISIKDSAGVDVSLDDVVSTALGEEDYLTVTQCGHSRLNGTFKILATENAGSGVISFFVENSNVSSTDYDETDVGGLAGIFTDQIPFDTDVYFLPNDELVADLFEDQDYVVQSSKVRKIVINNVTTNLEIPLGLRVNARRTSCVIPLRTTEDVNSVENFVAGDTVSIVGYERNFDISYVNTKDDIDVFITADGTTATVELLGGSTTSHLFEGQNIIIAHNGELSGTQTIGSITSTTTFTFDTDVTTITQAIGGVFNTTDEIFMTAHPFSVDDRVLFKTTGTMPAGLSADTLYYVVDVAVNAIKVSSTLGGSVVDITANTYTGSITAYPADGVIVGKTICVQENVEWYDDTADTTMVTVDRRWIPIEAPDDNFDITPAYRISHFSSNSYTNQDFIRSVMSADNMYFTNGSDTVKKFDGLSLYKAGLPRWQMNLFTAVKPGSGIIVPETSIAFNAVSNNAFTITTAGDESSFNVGDRIVADTDDAAYVIQRINTDTNKIFVDRNITGALSGNLLLRSVYRYYFRLNAVDANSNLMASAAVGQEDTYVELAETSKVQLKMIGIPTFDNLDYNRLELEIYRTKRNQSAPFYKIVTIPLDFNQSTGYITYTDTAEDDALTELDPINSALLGTELGTAWEEPMRAKYCTSSDNRLILANLTDYPQLDYVMDGEGATNDNLSGLILQFDRTSTIGTETDNLNTARFEFITDFGSSLTGVIEISKNFVASDVSIVDVVTDTISFTSAHNLSDGERVKFDAGLNTLPTGIEENVDYYVEVINVNAIKLYTDQDLTNPVDITALGAGPCTMFKLSSFSINTTSIGGLGAWNIGDWLYLYNRAANTPTGGSLEFAGWWQVSDKLGSNFITIKNEVTTKDITLGVSHITFATNKKDIPVYLGTDNKGDNDSNYQTRNAEAFGSTDEKNVAVQRLANAINVHQRRCQDVGFKPWISAHADGSYGQGQLILRQPNIQDTPFYVKLPETTAFDQYVNGVRVSSGSIKQAQVRRYPSRLLISYPNYPEIFDNPTAILPQNSDSVIDVNSADGQAITGVIPFYGDSAFGTGQKEDNLVVFKENSIYLVNVANKAAGLNDQVVKKLESRGLGCTAPYSIVSAKDSIFFANEAGIYRINRADMSIEYVGQMMERNWLNKVDDNQLDILHGTHNPIDKQYKLSVVSNDDPNIEIDVPNEVYVYHHSGEARQGEVGGWTRYDAHDAIGWANLAADSFWASTGGRVLQLRRTGDKEDFRDLTAPIKAQITSRAMDFGAPGIRKIIAAILTHYRAPTDIEGTYLTYSYDLREEFLPTDNLKIDRDETTTGLSDSVVHKGRTIRSTLDRKRAVYFQVRYTNDALDEELDVAGFTVKLAGLSDKGILEARETT